MPLVEGNTLDGIRDHGEARDRQYAQVGAFIARHSQILLALWDGVESQRVGGTAQVVKFKLEGIPEPYGPPPSPLDPPDSGPVYHLATPRQSNLSPRLPSFSLSVLYPKNYPNGVAAEKAYKRIHDSTEAFNRDAVRRGATLEEKRRESKERLLPAPLSKTLPDDLEAAMDVYAMADTLALYFKNLTANFLFVLLSLSFVALLASQISLLLPNDSAVRVFFFAVLLAIWFCYRWLTWLDCQNKFLDYRSLAEGLRIQLFWRLSGLSEAVADHFLRALRSELDWLRNALRFAIIAAPQGAAAAAPAEQLRALQLVHDYWVKKQHDFHERRAKDDDLSLRKLIVAGWMCFGIGLALTLIEMLLGPLQARLREMNLGTAANVVLLNLLIALRLAPLVAPLLYLYAKTMCLAEHVKQYRQASFLFNTAEEHLGQLLDEGKVEAARRLVLELGKEALQENGNWVLHHRRRPIKPPKVG